MRWELNRKPYGYGGIVARPSPTDESETTAGLMRLLRVQMEANAELQRALIEVVRRRESSRPQVPRRPVPRVINSTASHRVAAPHYQPAEARPLTTLCCAIGAGIAFTLAVAYLPGPGFVATPAFALIGIALMLGAILRGM